MGASIHEINSPFPLLHNYERKADETTGPMNVNIALILPNKESLTRFLGWHQRGSSVDSADHKARAPTKPLGGLRAFLGGPQNQ
jgi:hypothetical protein